MHPTAITLTWRAAIETEALPTSGGYAFGMKPERKRSALNRLKTVRGHLEAVITMVEAERYCPDVMKQVSALQGSLERVNRILLQNHLETCVAEAVMDGRTDEIVDELMETMKYTAAVTGPGQEPIPDSTVEERAAF